MWRRRSLRGWLLGKCTQTHIHTHIHTHTYTHTRTHTHTHTHTHTRTLTSTVRPNFHPLNFKYVHRFVPVQAIRQDQRPWPCDVLHGGCISCKLPSSCVQVALFLCVWDAMHAGCFACPFWTPMHTFATQQHVKACLRVMQLSIGRERLHLLSSSV
jgi:hypothetical protein